MSLPGTRSAAGRPRVLAAAAAVLALAALGAQPAVAAVAGTETRPFAPAGDEGPDVAAPKSNAPSHVPAANAPNPASLPVTADPASKRIEGLTVKDQRTSNGGNSFTLEPPDQALCVGNGRVIEGVNNVFAVYTTAGARLSGPQSYSPFWNDGVAEIVRSNPPVFGPFVSDPKCYFDPALNRFFMTELQLGTNPATGDFTGDSFVNVAVSRTAAPSTAAADWYLYRLNVRNDGTQGTPAHSGCPCLGDQPLIGADRYGFYVTTNEFSIEGSDFNGAQVYAFDKAALAAGTMKVQRLEQDDPPLAEGVAYSIQPATSPATTDWSTANNGTEYALSALEFTGGWDNRIAVWALTNTRSLTTANPAVTLSKTVIGSQVYGMPPAAQQKAGPYPLGQSLKQQLNLIETNDDRMNQTVFAGGKLWSGVTTGIRVPNGPTRSGVAYFVVTPSATASGVGGTIANQGYVTVNRNYTAYPSIAVAPGGTKAAMVFSLIGPDYYPSTAYVRLSSAGAVTSPVTVSGAGAAPADGFTGYPAFGGGGAERWGDYSAAVSDASGTLWMAGEYVPGTVSGFLANWGTAVSAVS